MKIEVSRIHQVRDEDKSVKAFADVVIEGAMAIHGVRIVEGKNGPFVSLPSHKGKDGEYREIVHPITKDAREALDKALMDAFKGLARTGPER